MYSIVLMMALSTGGDAPAFGHHGCCGGSSCCGGAVASCCGGGHGCHGGFKLFKGHKHGCCGGHSCCGGSSCCGGAVVMGCSGGCAGSAPAPAMAPAAPAAPAEKMPAPAEEKKPGAASLPTPATIVVSLPADAKLTIDETVTSSTSANRLFATPALEAGKDFYYTLKAEVVRDGKTFTSTQRVAVRAGEQSRVTLEVPMTSVASR